jgi:hypothetical protein
VTRRALERELKAAKKQDAASPSDAVSDLIANLEFQLTPAGIQDLLGDFPIVGLYGYLYG